MLIAQAGTKAQSKKNLERNDLFTRMKRLKNDIQFTVGEYGLSLWLDNDFHGFFGFSNKFKSFPCL